MILPNFSEHTMAVDRVERLLRKTAKALDDAGIPYAVIGGNAVALWVTTVDPEAVRTTKGVDLLVNQNDLARITETLEAVGLERVDLRRITLFLDPEKPEKKSGVHLVWSGRKVWPSNEVPAPTLDATVRSAEGVAVIDLASLVCMKLVADRYHDRAHIVDLLALGLIDETIRTSLPTVLREKLLEIEQAEPRDLLEE